MNPVVPALGPIILGAVDVVLVEGAARDLEDLSEEILTPGRSPSWSFLQVPDGLALCVGCWRVITTWQLGGSGVRAPAESRGGRQEPELGSARGAAAARPATSFLAFRLRARRPQFQTLAERSNPRNNPPGLPQALTCSAGAPPRRIPPR